MPRKCKIRRIFDLPIYDTFVAKNNNDDDFITLRLDEYECIRLIDFEGMTQAQCATYMNVLRTSVQAMYSSARKKIATCIVLGKGLKICGGDYVILNNNNSITFDEFRKKWRNKIMIVAVTYENGQVYQHFGHSKNFKIFNIQDNSIINSKVIDTNGNGHGALAGFLKENSVDIVICGGIGGGAKTALANAGIELYPGVSGSADEAVKALIDGTLSYNPDVVCSHHSEGHKCKDK